MRRWRHQWMGVILVVIGVGGCDSFPWEETGTFNIDLPTTEGLIITKETFTHNSYRSLGTQITYTAYNRSNTDSHVQVALDPGPLGNYTMAIDLTLTAFTTITGLITEKEAPVLTSMGKYDQTIFRFETLTPQNLIHLVLTVLDRHAKSGFGCQINRFNIRTINLSP